MNFERNFIGNIEVDIISCHVQKTAGTCFANILEAVYGNNKIYFDYGGLSVETRIKEGSINNQTKIIHGHFPLLRYKMFFPKAMTIIWLRHPVKRIISWYYFWLASYDNINGKLHRDLIKNKWSLLEFAQQPYLKNQICNFFLSNTIKLSSFNFIGLQEYFHEDYCELKRMLGWPDVVVEKARVNKFQGYYEKVKEAIKNERLINELCDINSKDIRLYSDALKIRKCRKKSDNTRQEFE